jgi:hypothetical protein
MKRARVGGRYLFVAGVVALAGAFFAAANARVAAWPAGPLQRMRGSQGCVLQVKPGADHMCVDQRVVTRDRNQVAPGQAEITLNQAQHTLVSSRRGVFRLSVGADGSCTAGIDATGKRARVRTEMQTHTPSDALLTMDDGVATCILFASGKRIELCASDILYPQDKQGDHCPATRIALFASPGLSKLTSVSKLTGVSISIVRARPPGSQHAIGKSRPPTVITLDGVGEFSILEPPSGPPLILPPNREMTLRVMKVGGEVRIERTLKYRPIPALLNFFKMQVSSFPRR